MLKPEIIAKIKQIQLKAGYLTSDALSGEYSSAFKGLGQEFDKVREYFHGDDIRSIDWNVTARMNEPFVKVFREEREMTLMLMVDVSPSQQFGTTDSLKQEQAAELAAILAFLAIKNSDKVGLIVFSDHVEQFIRPAKGQAHIWSMIRSVLTHKSKGQKTDISEAIAYMLQVVKRKSMCFLISDFQSESYEKNLRALSRKHDLTCCVTRDPRESSLTKAGLLELTDPESGEVYVIDTSHQQTRSHLQSAFTSEERSLQKTFRKNKAGYFFVDTHKPAVDQVLRYFKERERRAVR